MMLIFWGLEEQIFELGDQKTRNTDIYFLQSWFPRENGEGVILIGWYNPPISI